LPDEGVDEIYGKRADTVIAGTAVPGGGKAVPVRGGYRISGHWQFGSSCREASSMLGSFQVLGDDGLGAGEGRSSFTAVDFHHLLLAGLPALTETGPGCAGSLLSMRVCY
jgi:hypothetical protein